MTVAGLKRAIRRRASGGKAKDCLGRVERGKGWVGLGKMMEFVCDFFGGEEGEWTDVHLGGFLSLVSFISTSCSSCMDVVIVVAFAVDVAVDVAISTRIWICIRTCMITAESVCRVDDQKDEQRQKKGYQHEKCHCSSPP